MNGVCRVCGCTDVMPCTILSWDDPSQVVQCAWLDEAHTLCSNPACVAEVPVGQLLDICFPRLPRQLRRPAVPV
jgi:hypothetical protein